jgi:hypothetical protein
MREAGGYCMTSLFEGCPVELETPAMDAGRARTYTRSMGDRTCDKCGAIATAFHRAIGDTHIDYACSVHAAESGKAWRSLAGFGAARHAAARPATNVLFGESEEK